MARNPKHVNWNHQMVEQAQERIRKLQAERDELLELARIGSELAGHVTRPVALALPFDRDVLRHWANRFHEAKRAIAKAESEAD